MQKYVEIKIVNARKIQGLSIKKLNLETAKQRLIALAARKYTRENIQINTLFFKEPTIQAVLSTQ